MIPIKTSHTNSMMKRPITPQAIVPGQVPVVVNNPSTSSVGIIHIAPKPSTVTMTASPTSSVSQSGHTAILPKTALAPLAPAIVAAPSTASSSKTQAPPQDSVSPSSVSTNEVTGPKPSEPPLSGVPAHEDLSKISTVWYLGGNHILKLLTSVDGDLDPSVLENLASVPSVVGELALSVESLVSDDATVGGFENDLLAKIASNTLTGKRGSLAEAAVAAAAAAAAVAAPPQLVSRSSSTTSNASMASSASSNQPQQQEPSIQEDPEPVALPPLVGNVPNPLLADYKPVPNPLARITPPTSPNVNGKRSGSDDSVGPDTKRIRPTTEITMIQAR